MMCKPPKRAVNVQIAGDGSSSNAILSLAPANLAYKPKAHVGGHLEDLPLGAVLVGEKVRHIFQQPTDKKAMRKFATCLCL